MENKILDILERLETKVSGIETKVNEEEKVFLLPLFFEEEHLFIFFYNKRGKLN